MKAVVDEYLANRAGDHAYEVAYFGNRRQSFQQAVAAAARSRMDGTLHPHQRRVGHERMARCADALADHLVALHDSEDFSSLHDAVKLFFSPIERVGELAIYDVAERIGWYRGLEPREVYLHCGTREGARAVNPKLRGGTASMDEFPLELQRLSPAQAESLLCIYKNELTGLRNRGLL